MKIKVKDLLLKYGFVGASMALALRQAQLAERNEKRYKESLKQQQADGESARVNALDKEIQEEEFKNNLKIHVKNLEDKTVEVDKIQGKLDNSQTASDKEYYTKELNKASKEKQEMSDELNQKILKSDISEIFMQIGDKYQSFLETLSSVQISAIINLTFDYLLFSSAFTVLSLFLGDHLIDKFKLEENFPRLAKIIRIRSKINMYYKNIYIIIHFALIFLAVLGNIFLFFMTYF